MTTNIAVIAALVLTLVLPVYPAGVDPLILAFLGLTVIGATAGLMHRAARRELVVISPWIFVVFIALIVGSVRNPDARQALEDAVPYTMFILGLLAGRGLRWPPRILFVVVVVCAIDSAVSLWLMPGYSPGLRSTYTYWKIITGLPLVGMFVSTLLRHTDPSPLGSSLLRRPLHLVMYVVMIFAMLFSVSRGMVLGWVIGSAVMAYVRRPSRALAAAVILILAFAGYSNTFLDLGQTYLRTDQTATVSGRVREIETAWDSFVQQPLFGSGLGSTLEFDGYYRSFVHNMIIYHLWKFGLVGTLLLLLPVVGIGRQFLSAPPQARAIVIGSALGISSYLITSAVYKNYYLLWMYGLVAGATLSWIGHLRRLGERSRPFELGDQNDASTLEPR